MNGFKSPLLVFWLCLWGVLSIGLSEQYVLKRKGTGVFEDQSYNDPLGELSDYERRAYAYEAARRHVDNEVHDDVSYDVSDDVSNDESENDASESNKEIKEWFLGKIDEHRNELRSQPKKVKKEEIKHQGETEEDREALRREEEKNERELAKKKKKSTIPIPGQLFEGDIVMTHHLRDHITGVADVKRDALKYKEYQWPKDDDGKVRIPYEINDNFNELKRSRLADAIQDYDKYTCIRFIPKQDGDKNYLHFFSNKSMCYSSVGLQGGEQKVSIGDGCERKGTLIHEMLHSIGFIHEQSRPDRDDHVKVVWDNIKEDLVHNFEKYPGYMVTNMGVQYDFDSVLHYHNRAFTKNGEDTLIDKQDPKREFGQRIGFSKRNIEQVNDLYKCDVDPSVMDDVEFL